MVKIDEKVTVDLGNVQKTLFLPLWGRAVESQKAKPKLIDRQAVEIINRIDLDVSTLYEKMDDLSQIAWIQRSLIGDRMIGRFLEKHPEGPVVNIGCGLDTTFTRMDNDRVQWFDLDLPDVIGLRKRFIDETERRKFIASSFLDEAWMNFIPAGGPVFFLAAGVFYYFEPDEIKDFLLRLLDKFPGSEILFDVSSPVGVRVANQKVIESSGLSESSNLKWGLENKKDILAWDSRLKLTGTYHYFRDFRMSLRNILLGTFSDIMGIQYMLHLKLGEA